MSIDLDLQRCLHGGVKRLIINLPPHGPSSSPAVCASGSRLRAQKTMYIEPGSPWENGYCESFNSKIQDEFLKGELFYSMKELRVLAER